MDIEIFDIYFAGIVAMTIHPGFTRGDATPFTIAECSQIAQQMLVERDKLINPKQEKLKWPG